MKSKFGFLVLLLLLALVRPLSVVAQEENQTATNTTEPTPYPPSGLNKYFDVAGIKEGLQKAWKGVVILSSGMRDVFAIFADGLYYMFTGHRLSPESRGIWGTVFGFLGLYWLVKRKLNLALAGGSWLLLAVALFVFLNLESLGGML